ncbi:MAG: thiamine phosphate synthase [Candidatus Firestonebacteria bacterium]
MISKKSLSKKLKGIYAIIDPAVCAAAGNDAFLTAKTCLSSGIKLLQLRYKYASDEQVLALAEKLKKECVKHKALFILNDRADLAVLCKADGLHLGQSDLPVKEARKIFKGFIGVSTHNNKEINKALIDKVDNIGFGPVFFTATKKGLPATVGLQKLRRVTKKVKIPVVAIGGINKANIRGVFNAGANCAAVISEICQADNLKETIKKLTIDY